METKIKATDIYLEDFHRKASELFYIPSLQRPYSWDAKKQVDRLWDDIIENDLPYYIGSIVCILGSGSISKDQIIDGQQRITTLHLMLISIRDYIFEIRDDDLKDIVGKIDQFLIQYSSEGKQVRLSFSNEASDLVFKAIINGDNLDKYKTEGQKRFIKNFEHLKIRVRDFCGKGKIRSTRIRDLFNRIKSLQLIFIECVDKSSAFRLFESINATGIDLTTNDLIKNSLFEFLNEEKTTFDFAESGWKNMYEEFNENSSSLKTYIRHHWISTEDYTSHSKLFDEFLKKYKSADGVYKYAQSLYNLAPVYRAIREGNVEVLSKLSKIRNEQNEVRDLLKFLGSLGVDQVYPVLLNIYENEPENFKKDLIKLAAFQFIFKHIPGSPSVPEKKFANYCKNKLYKGKIDRNTLMNELVNLCRGKETDFSNKLIEKTKYTGGNSIDTQFILEKYLYFYGKPSKFADPTIEHIIPQDSKDKIYSLFLSDSCSTNRKINSLGNLTILEKFENSSSTLFNQEFYKKYPLYKKHVFIANKNIAKYGFDINPQEAIDKRSEAIAKMIYKIFFHALETGKWMTAEGVKK